MFFVADIGSFLRTLSDKIAYLYVKSTKLLQIYNVRLLLFTRSSKDVHQSGLIGIREELDSKHSSETERRESLSGRFLSFWKPGEALRVGAESRLQQLHLQTLQLSWTGRSFLHTPTHHRLLVPISLWQVCQISSPATSSRTVWLQQCNNIIIIISCFHLGKQWKASRWWERAHVLVSSVLDVSSAVWCGRCVFVLQRHVWTHNVCLLSAIQSERQLFRVKRRNTEGFLFVPPVAAPGRQQSRPTDAHSPWQEFKKTRILQDCSAPSF